MAAENTEPALSAPPREPSFPLVVIAASAGGLAALRTVLSGLPAGFPAAVLVVQHLERKRPSMMADILSRHTALEVRQAQEDDAIEPGLVLIAPPNHHLVVSEDERIHLTETALVHFVRPSADLLFESAAGIFGHRVIAVVLTGTGLDGSMELAAIRRGGGVVIAQDRASSEFYGMPGAAAATGEVDYVLPLKDIATCLAELAGKDD